tara:strand:+ start:234 stop:1952 length:1719 start_codon:yes stop_codon:yes gene_type:complete
MTNRLNVLIVDDDPEDYLIVSTMLAKATNTKFVVTHAVSFEEISRVLANSTYDAILLDYYLGKHSALDVLSYAREVNFIAPIIVITGLGQSEIDAEVTKRGAADYLPKEELSSTLLERTILHAIEHINTQNKLRKMVRQDGLTGLANRLHFEDELDRVIAQAQRKERNFGVVFIDLDRFKDVNDSLGHHVGDLLIKLVADRLLRSVRKGDLVARIGGDEFTILLSELSDVSDAVAVANKILREINLPTPITSLELVPSASIGIATYPDGGTTHIELMQHADLALYKAKEQGKNQVYLFDSSLREQLERELLLEKRLRHALETGQGLALYFQPQVDMQTGELVGAEALLRWNDELLGGVLPTEFIEIAEKTRQIVQLGDWVLETALRQCKAWRLQGLTIPVSVNVSPVQLRLPGFSIHFLDRVKQHGLQPSDIELEVTEAVFIGQDDLCAEALQEIYDANTAIAIDDFGTGYSSLSYLRQLPVSRLKIDRSFVSCDKDSGIVEEAIIQSIVELSKSLGLALIAEGVETEQQKNALIKIGCVIAQGYFFGKPLPPDAFANQWITSAGTNHEKSE